MFQDLLSGMSWPLITTVVLLAVTALAALFA